VTHVRLKNLRTGSVSDLKTDGVFIAIGHKPATELFAGQLDMKPGGYLQTLPESTATNIPGVVRGRRRHRRRLSPGRDSGRHGLYGSVGS
jgi:alkyl hydroperoxide reductase subunit AhpF